VDPRRAIGQTGDVRYLTIVRHTKSSPAGPGEPDFHRPLSGRGRRECKQLREWASDPEALGRYGPVTALVSSAARTRETFRRAFDGTDFVAAYEFSSSIYNGVRNVDGEDLLDALVAIDPVSTSLLVVGHNPTVHELAELLADELPASLRHNYPLGGAYVLALPDAEPLRQRRYEVVASFIPD
jgi:phosphohistidine phosphatase